MCATHPQPSQFPALGKKVIKMKDRVDNLILKMQKNKDFSPTRDELDTIAEDIIDFINDNHEKTLPFESYLKAAIIDLTEVPEMSPQMQKISFLTALKDASKELELFLSNWH